MTHTEVYIDKCSYRLGHRVGKGGEGVVFALGDDKKYAVKIYTASDGESKEEKIAAMVRAQLAGCAPLVAFPISIARSKNGAFVGFVMKLVSDHKPLHDLYSPGSRKQHFPQADYRYLVRSATNFARAVASVHKSQCVIGDINHSGVLVSPKATVSLIDADSFQFSESGQRFLCKVGVPEYTPPELQGKSLAGVLRTPNHDAFGMAVVIFQLLLMGRHPFVGTVRQGDIPPLHENIQHFRYVYAENRDVGMDQPPGTPSLTDFSPKIAALFDAAFSQPTSDRRPTAEQWVNALEAFEGTLEQCQDNQLHYVPRDASECSWCDMERQTGTFLFLPYVPRPELRVEGFDPGAGGFNLDHIWAKIESIRRTTSEPPSPQQVNLEITPSEQAKNARKAISAKNPIGYLILFAAIGALFTLPNLWIIWIGLAFWGFGLSQKSEKINPQPFVSAFINAETRWIQAVDEWHRRIGYNDFLALDKELTAARDAYKALGEEERSFRSKYQNERRDRQLRAFLDQFDIQHGSIHGMGPSKQTTLASYGIDTAADVVKARLLNVPGFGEVNSRGLLDWRAKLEKRFVYQAQENNTDRQEIARICSALDAKAVPLRRKLSVGPQNLELLANRIKQAKSITDPVLSQVQRQREQAKCDLAFLTIPVPHIPQARTPPAQIQPRQSAVQSATYRPSSQPSTSTSSQKCPRCGNAMVKRLAKRGRNAGGYFWGCSRYPRCKGTRSI